MTRVALIAHDEKKSELIEFAHKYETQLREYDLSATGTTGKRLMEETDLEVERKESGPLGGDLMIGSEVAEGLRRRHRVPARPAPSTASRAGYLRAVAEL